MKDNSDQWVIKAQSDQVKGPYTTEVLKNMIVNGAFSGNEEVCAYPEGEWQVLTRQPEFYDALLESLENPVEADNKKSQKMEAETVVRISTPESREVKSEIPGVPLPQITNAQDLKSFIESEIKEEKARKENRGLQNRGQQTVLPPQKTAKDIPIARNILDERDQNFIIHLTDLKKLKEQELKKLLPFILIAILLLSGLIYFLLPGSGSGAGGWALIAPQKKKETISADDLKDLKKKTVKAFQSGLIEQLLEAQRHMIEAVEGAPKDLEAQGLLCIVYEQLWPYTRQTVEDLKSIVTVTQLARQINPISNYSESCQAVFLLTKGQSKEARSLLEKTLDNQIDEKFSLGTFLYFIKGEILESESSFVNAGAYYEQAVNLWPAWSSARFGLGRMLYKQKKYAEAREQFLEMYKANKESKAALFGLALIDLKSSGESEKALVHFSNGFKLKQQLPKDFITEALLNYAQLLVDRSDTAKALEVAQQGYRLSPSHRGLKEIVVSLGGSEVVDNAAAEIILIGKQFQRAGDCLVAQAQFKAAFEVDPNNASAAFNAAVCLWQINQTRDAVIWLEKAIKVDSTMVQAHVLKADYESQKYNFINAAKTLAAAAKLFPRNHEIMKAQALLEFRKNNMSGAIQYGERAVKIYNADVELLTLLAQAHISFYLNAPTVKREDQERSRASKEAAQRYAGRAVDLEPAWPEAQITYAKLLSAVDGPMRGEIYMKDLIKTYPYTIEYRLALADFFKVNEKYLEASLVYEQIVSIDAKNKKANFGLAECYRIMNKSDLAQRYYNVASALDPSDVEPMFANAKLLIETASGNEVKAKIEQALAKLELVRKINPEFPKVAFLMSKCYMELNDFAKAIELIREEKMKNPNIADSFILAAEIFYRKGQFKECAAEYSAAIKMRPNSAELYVKSSICYRNSDALDIAEDMLAIAMQKESGYADIYREQGYIFERRGNREQAILSLEKYIVLSPNALDRDATESKIRELGGGR